MARRTPCSRKQERMLRNVPVVEKSVGHQAKTLLVAG